MKLLVNGELRELFIIDYSGIEYTKELILGMGDLDYDDTVDAFKMTEEAFEFWEDAIGKLDEIEQVESQLSEENYEKWITFCNGVYGADFETELNCKIEYLKKMVTVEKAEEIGAEYHEKYVVGDVCFPVKGVYEFDASRVYGIKDLPDSDQLEVECFFIKTCRLFHEIARWSHDLDINCTEKLLNLYCELDRFSKAINWNKAGRRDIYYAIISEMDFLVGCIDRGELKMKDMYSPKNREAANCDWIFSINK